MEITCKGSMKLGSGCGRCTRCLNESNSKLPDEVYAWIAAYDKHSTAKASLQTAESTGDKQLIAIAKDHLTACGSDVIKKMEAMHKVLISM